MAKSFVPFDDFERGCLPDGKSLSETMQENCKDRLAPKKEPCRKSCLPYWQRTSNFRCLGIGLLEYEEEDGCGNSRWVRTAESVIWQTAEETRCDELNNRIQKKQFNQCGGERWITTSELCCKPEWVFLPEEDGGQINCDQTMLRRLQTDGCGHERLYSTGQPVTWASTGEQRCEPGDIYQVEQVNQCGDTRWTTVPGGCPCIPDWQPSGPERCTGYYVERQETDGCGHTRWQSTGTQVEWTNTGETRCNGGFIQRQQVSQCGSTRWSTTEIACSSSPPATEVGSKWDGERLSGNGSVMVTMRLDAAAGKFYWQYAGEPTQSESWVTGAFDKSHYEARITWVADQPADGYRARTGSAIDVWHDLGDVPLLSISLGITAPNQIVVNWSNNVVRFDIRKKGEGATGGITFGPMLIRVD